MKASEIRDMSLEEMRRKADELKQELFNLRFQHSNGQLESPQRIKQTRRSIARVKSLLREREMQQTAK
jgi:large subunit ribosomal protein L29